MLVVDAGSIAEYGKPAELLTEANGAFSQLVAQVPKSTRPTMHSSVAVPSCDALSCSTRFVTILEVVQDCCSKKDTRRRG